MSEVLPTLTAEAVRATGAYALAYSICALMFTAGIIISRIPPLSRSLRSEGRALYMSALTSIALLSSLLSIDLILRYLQGELGVPDWSKVVLELSEFEGTAKTTLDAMVYSVSAYMAAMAILGIVSYIFAPLQIVLLLVHNVFTHMGLFISMIGALALIALIFSGVVRIIISIASHSYFLVAFGIALYPLRWTRGLGVTLLIFGIAMYYGLPLSLGYVQAPSQVLGDEELARSRLLSALSNQSVPVNLVVKDMNGNLLPWSYVTLNSSVEFAAPANSSIAVNYSVGNIRKEALVRYQFEYSRFYNGSLAYGEEEPISGWEPPQLMDLGLLDKTRTVLYRKSNVTGLWFMGMRLNYTPATLNIEGGIDMNKPDNALKNIKTAKEYYDYIYGRSPTVEVEAPWVESLNNNASAVTFYSEQAYRTIGRVEEKTYRFNLNLTRTHYNCWVSRTKTWVDENNQTHTVYYYRANAYYYGESPEKLYVAYKEDLSPNPDARIKTWDGDFTPSLHLGGASLSDVEAKGLILGSGSLTISPANRIDERFELGREQALVAQRYLVPGRIVGSGETLAHEVEPPEDITLDPSPKVMDVWVSGDAQRESGEQEGNCPELPTIIPVSATVQLSADETPAWDPVIRWEPLTKSGDIHAYKLYEQDPKHPHLNPTVSKEEDGGILRQLIKWVLRWGVALFLPLMVADAASGMLGGYSFGAAIIGGMKRLLSFNLFSRFLRGGAMRGSGISLRAPFKKALSEEEKALLKRLEFERFKALKEGDRMKWAYATIALAAYDRARRIRPIWIFGRKKKAEALREFYQTASRLLPEEAVLAQRLHHAPRVEITREQAKEILGGYVGTGGNLLNERMSSLMASPDVSAGFARALLTGRGRVDDRFVRGYVKPDSYRSQRRFVLAATMKPASRLVPPNVLGMVYDVALPSGSGPVKNIIARRLMTKSGFDIHQEYNAAKMVRIHRETLDEGAAPILGDQVRGDKEVEPPPPYIDTVHSMYHHGADLHLSDHLQGTIENNPSGEPGRTMGIDTRGTEDYGLPTRFYVFPKSYVTDDEFRAASSMVIGSIRDMERSSDRHEHPIGRHTGGKGYDWWWEAR